MVWRRVEVDGQWYAIGKVEYAILRMAKECDGVTPSKVWARFGVKWSFLIGAFDRLEEKGLIYKNGGEYYISDIGEEVMKKCDKWYKDLYVRGEI